jgi:drug/metabolite transporter (DMT)-like permease
MGHDFSPCRGRCGTVDSAGCDAAQRGIVAGALDTIGNLFYFQASRFGRLDVAALVCSLYPAGTILLAALVLREWPTRRQVAGMALALCAVVLLSV